MKRQVARHRGREGCTETAFRPVLIRGNPTARAYRSYGYRLTVSPLLPSVPLTQRTPVDDDSGGEQRLRTPNRIKCLGGPERRGPRERPPSCKR